MNPIREWFQDWRKLPFFRPPGPISTINLWKGSSLYTIPNHHVNYVKPWKISREALKREFKNRLQQAYFLTLMGHSVTMNVGGWCGQPSRCGVSGPAPRVLLSPPLHTRGRSSLRGLQPPWVPRGSHGAHGPKLVPLRNRRFLIQYEVSF